MSTLNPSVLSAEVQIRSMVPSPSTSSRADRSGAASVPVAPNRIPVGSTVVASNVAVVRMALESPLCSVVDAIREAAGLDIHRHGQGR